MSSQISRLGGEARGYVAACGVDGCGFTSNVPLRSVTGSQKDHAWIEHTTPAERHAAYVKYAAEHPGKLIVPLAPPGYAEGGSEAVAEGEAEAEVASEVPVLPLAEALDPNVPTLSGWMIALDSQNPDRILFTVTTAGSTGTPLGRTSRSSTRAS
jgi:hypothetical protein